jgi:hypothetical protein
MTRKRDAATHLGYCRFRCRQCGRRFNERTGTPFNHLEFPTDIVFQVVVFRLLFKLSLRDLVRMFLMRGYEFTHETVREWEERFAPLWLSAASAVSKLIFHYELTPQEKKIAAPAVHYGFGTSVAAAYGAAVEVLPVLRTGWGMPLGGLARRARDCRTSAGSIRASD